jgi:2-oxoglutarate dehydrogenase E1 component
VPSDKIEALKSAGFLIADGVSPTPALGERASVDDPAVRAATRDSIRALMLIRAYRVRGHLEANLDPLGLKPIDPHPSWIPSLRLHRERTGPPDLHRQRARPRDRDAARDRRDPARHLLRVDRRRVHAHPGSRPEGLDPGAHRGIRNQTGFTVNGKRAILERLTEAEGFEQFLHVKYTGTKRFGLDGGESDDPGDGADPQARRQLGVEEIVIGMPHRGRLNVLANVMGKPYVAIFSEFQGAAHPEDVQGSGDVKYHLGTSTDRVRRPPRSTCR